MVETVNHVFKDADPWVEIAGYNQNGRPVPLFFNADEIPKTVNDWIRVAEDKGVNFSSDLTKQKGVTAYKSCGYWGILSSDGSLEEIIEAEALRRVFADKNIPVQIGAALINQVTTKGVSRPDLIAALLCENSSFGIERSARNVAKLFIDIPTIPTIVEESINWVSVVDKISKELLPFIAGSAIVEHDGLYYIMLVNIKAQPLIIDFEDEDLGKIYLSPEEHLSLLNAARKNETDIQGAVLLSLSEAVQKRNAIT